jgi:hypothetical protein
MEHSASLPCWANSRTRGLNQEYINTPFDGLHPWGVPPGASRMGSELLDTNLSKKKAQVISSLMSLPGELLLELVQ